MGSSWPNGQVHKQFLDTSLARPTHTDLELCQRRSVSTGSDASMGGRRDNPLANYTQEMQALVHSIIALTSGSGSTETFLTVLNPYSLLNTPRSTWMPGDSATSVDPDTGQYVEDIGPALDYVWQDGIGWGTIGHFVLVNDTRLTNGHGWSSSPDVNVDYNGNIHIVWVDGRSSIPRRLDRHSFTTCNWT